MAKNSHQATIKLTTSDVELIKLLNGLKKAHGMADFTEQALLWFMRTPKGGRQAQYLLTGNLPESEPETPRRDNQKPPAKVAGTHTAEPMDLDSLLAT